MKKKKEVTQAVKMMCNLLQRFGTDQVKEKNGVKFYIDEINDVWILISRFNGRNSELQKGLAQIAIQYGDETTSEEVISAHNVNFIKSCVKDWNNICDNDGVEISFTQDVAIEILTKTPDLLDELVKFAIDGDNYRLDDVIKN